MHNGYIGDFHVLRRDLMLAVDPELFADVHGSTDTEVVFHLALTFGLEEDPIAALERTVGLIEATARRHGVADAVQAQLRRLGRRHACGRSATRRGPGALAVRLGGRRRVRRLHPENPRFPRLAADDRLIVSEPFSDLPGVWQRDPRVERR